jgi:integrase
LRLKSPKTRHGRRTITLPPETVATLRAHKVKLLEFRVALGLGKIALEILLFGTVEEGLQRARNLSKAWSRVREAKKLPRVSFHALRHSHASVLIRAGVDIPTISRLGHSKASVTLDVYGHLIGGAHAAAAKAMAGVLGTPTNDDIAAPVAITACSQQGSQLTI